MVMTFKTHMDYNKQEDLKVWQGRRQTWRAAW